jgi:hypothetical protein
LSFDGSDLLKVVLALTQAYEYLAMGAALALLKSYGDEHAI